MSETRIRALYVDIGGVLATNGWDTDTRHQAVEHFQLDAHDVDSRHRLTFELYETGKMSWDDYLQRVIFHEPRQFTKDDFTRFVLEASKPFPEMLVLVKRLKAAYSLKVVAVSNEGRELTEHRIRLFDLCSVVDIYVCSCFVHLRKPDNDIYRVACDLAQVPADEGAYLEDRPMFVEVANALGFHGVLHQSYEGTRAELAKLGLA